MSNSHDSFGIRYFTAWKISQYRKMIEVYIHSSGMKSKSCSMKKGLIGLDRLSLRQHDSKSGEACCLQISHVGATNVERLLRLEYDGDFHHIKKLKTKKNLKVLRNDFSQPGCLRATKQALPEFCATRPPSPTLVTKFLVRKRKTLGGGSQET